MATYVCSDIHGLSDKYYAMLESIDLTKDTLFILGDVIDRGPKGFEILMDSLQRENVQLLMGNHEYMMLEALEEHGDQVPNDFSVFNWILNGGAPTIAAYNKASLKEKRFVQEALKKLPYAYTSVTVNDRRFYLCHSAPGKAKRKNIVHREDLVDPMHFVWNRMCPNGPFLRGKTIVAGHTIVLNYHADCTIYSDTSDLKTAHYINIDCGCAMQDEKSRLALLCLDTMEVKYF